jgi:hypothetical protein
MVIPLKEECMTLDLGTSHDLGDLGGKETPTYGMGRTCAICGRPLSKYNKTKTCFSHKERPKWENTADYLDRPRKGAKNKKKGAAPEAPAT